jgi:hypothetical protein
MTAMYCCWSLRKGRGVLEADGHAIETLGSPNRPRPKRESGGGGARILDLATLRVTAGTHTHPVAR